MAFARGIYNQLGNGQYAYAVILALGAQATDTIGPHFRSQIAMNGHNPTPWGNFYPKIDAKNPIHHNRYKGGKIRVSRRLNEERKSRKPNKAPITVRSNGKTATFPYARHDGPHK